MWNRRDIKEYAKDFLRKYYWKAFLVCLIATLLGGGGSAGGGGGGGNNYDNNYNDGTNFEVDDYYQEGTYNLRENDMVERFNKPPFNFAARRFSLLSVITGGAIGIIAILFVVLLITIGFAIEVGKSRFFLRGFEGDVRIKTLFSTFNSEEYLPIVKTQFLRGLYTLLWTLLFIIPGIIKTYEYRLVPYILSEDSNLTSSEVITMSREMTHGHKMDMFILDLSFIGWYLLGALLFGIGVLFVDPYVEATNARLYNILSGNDHDEHEYIDSDMIIN